MLIQIISDRQATYQVSKRMSQLLNVKRAVVNRENRHHPNASVMAPGMRNAGTMSINRRGGGNFQAT